MQGRSFKFFFKVYLVLYLLYFSLNFYGSPFLKELFALLSFMTIAATLRFSFNRSLFFLLMLFFIEGQGRILWGYSPFFRIVFDLAAGIAVVKTISINFLNTLKQTKRKKKFILNQVPFFFLILFGLHVLWFFVSLFNPLGAGVLPSFATVKYYIFPCLLFLVFLIERWSFKGNYGRRLIMLINLIMILEGALCIHQKYMGGYEFLTLISPLYLTLHKFALFQNELFRPFGTTFAYGVAGTFFYLTIGFNFLLAYKTRIEKIIFPLLITISWATLFISQVRTNFIQHILIISGIYILWMLGPKKKLETFIKFISGAIICIFIFFITVSQLDDDTIKQFDLDSSVNRLVMLKEKGVGRSGPLVVFSEIHDRLKEHPLGIGPGMATGFLSSFLQRRELMPDVLISAHTFWTLDNLVVFIITELGFGGAFYLLIIFGMMIYILKALLKVWHRKDHESYRIIVVSFIVTVTITFANWGAISIPYNPVSFFYWFWVAIGLKAYYRHNKNYR